MITINDQTTVGELASSVPGSIRVFQQYGIDFCCGGGKTLAEACREKGVSVEGVLAGVENAQRASDRASGPDWNTAPLSQLIDHILSKHHSYLRIELPRLAAMLAKVIEVHGANHPESLHPLARLYAGLTQELDQHMMKEENILFPLIVQLEHVRAAGAGRIPMMPVDGPIGVMEMEHESAGEALRQMRAVTSDYRVPEDGCATYGALLDGLRDLEADLHEHIHLENNILFPRALELSR